MKHWSVLTAATALSIGATACASWDNPTALDDLQALVTIEIEADPVETYNEVEIMVHAMQDGRAMHMLQAQIEIQHAGSTEPRVVELHPEGDGYAAHVRFFEPGDTHLHFMGRPEGHQMMAEMGESETHVNRLHQMVGPIWVEVEMSPGEVTPGTEAHVHLHAFLTDGAGMPTDSATGLTMHVEMHDLAGSMAEMTVVEEVPGEYEFPYHFGDAGMYEMHVEIEIAGIPHDAEFLLPVMAPTADSTTQQTGGTGGHGH